MKQNYHEKLFVFSLYTFFVFISESVFALYPSALNDSLAGTRLKKYPKEWNLSFEQGTMPGNVK